MSKHVRFIKAPWAILILIFLLAACGEEEVPIALSTFGNSPKAVAAEFQSFYDTQGGFRIFGIPVTEGYAPNEGDPLQQYYQTLLLDFDADRPAGEQVSVAALGEWALAGMPDLPLAPLPADGRVRTFPDTEFTVTGDFLDFYERYDGEKLFGPPISPPLLDGGITVQYFRNARLEQRPELSPDLRVQITPYGQAHFARVGIFAKPQEPRANLVPEAGIREARVTAVPRASTLYSDQEQILYVTVMSLFDDPMEGIRVTATLDDDEQQSVLWEGTTNGEGRVQLTGAVSAVPLGEAVQITVTAYSVGGEPLGTARVSFLTWW